MNETTSLRWRSHATKAAINYHSIDHDENDEEGNDQDKKLNPRGRLCFGARVIDGVAATAAASSIVTWMVSENIVSKTACASTFLFGPFAACQQRKLRHLGTLRKNSNQLREEVNYLHQEKERLQRGLERLDSNIMQMERMEGELIRIAGSPHNVNRLLEVVAEQKEVHDGIKSLLKRNVLQDILRALVTSDQDKDFTIHSRELDILIVRLNMMKGVKFHEERFRQCVQSSKSLSQIMRLIRSLLEDDDESVFVLCPEELTK